MPTNCTRPSYSRDSAASEGASSLQGPHQEAQMLTRAGVPWSCVSSVLNVARSKVGSAVGLPGRRVPLTLGTGDGPVAEDEPPAAAFDPQAAATRPRTLTATTKPMRMWGLRGAFI